VADLNRLAARIVKQATDDVELESPQFERDVKLASRAIGGRTRAERMTPEERSQAARKAALRSLRA
jgi:hypothetical protein